MNTNRAAARAAFFAPGLGLMLLTLAGCSARSRPVATAPATVTTTSHAIASAGEAVAGTLKPQALPVLRDIHPRTTAEDEATRIFRSLHPKLLGCYARRLASRPDARAYVVVDVLVGGDGRPRDVSASGGGMLGRATVDCMVGHVRAAAFAPPASGGTSRVRVPFTFRPDASADDG